MVIFRKGSSSSIVIYRKIAVAFLASLLALPLSIVARAQTRATSARPEGSRITPGAAVAVEEHMLAAQQAQGRKDYAEAEREYGAVIALAPRFPRPG
jgi:hypothetical protein